MLKRGVLRSLGIILIIATSSASLRPGLPSRAQVDAPQDGFSLRLPLLVLNYSPGTISGQVIDASDRSNQVGASVCASPGNCVVTDLNGIYSIRVDSGLRLLTAQAVGHYNVTQQVIALSSQAVPLNFALSPYLSSGDVDRRIVLTWSDNPYWCNPGDTQCENDLDAHLWIQALQSWHFPDPNNPNIPNGDCTNVPYACLELDTRKGFGPETVAIAHFETAATYFYGVLDYNYGYPGVPPIIETGAHVELYDQDGQLMSFDVPRTGTGNFWYVFNYTFSSGTGSWVIQPVNCITLYHELITETILTCP